MEIKDDIFLPSVILPCQLGNDVYRVFPVADVYGYRTGKHKVVPTTVKRVDIYVKKDLVKYNIVSSEWDSCGGKTLSTLCI